MRILFIGDVVSSAGCEHVRRVLPVFRRTQEIDFCIINGENSAEGNGITPFSYEHLLTSGADLITTGNHALKRHEIEEYFDKPDIPLIRPANFHRSAPGKGSYILEKKGLRLGVINLIGTVYMDFCDSPFDCADSILEDFSRQGIKNIFVDFHCEATSEKRVMGFYLDGKVSAVAGTHTHVQTADEQILPGGTAYITDTGMTGVINSVLGVEISCAERKVRTGLPVRFRNPSGPCSMGCIIVETDNTTGRAVSIERFSVE